MKKLLLVGLVSILSSGIAQESKFNIGGSIFPHLSSRILVNDNAPNGLEEVTIDISAGRVALSGNIFIAYEFSPKALLSIGLGYINFGERTQRIDLIPAMPDPAIPNQIRFINTYHNVEIPVNFQFYLTPKLYANGGASGIINITNTAKSIGYFEDGSVDRTSATDNSIGFRRLNATINLGFGIDLIQNENLNFFIGPYAQYTILGLAQKASLNRKFLSTGFSTGIHF